MSEPACPVILRPFTPGDQKALRDLVLTGLGEHWGYIDETLNPDLADIQRHYVDRGGYVLVAEHSNVIVGCGMLIAEEPDAGRLVRMSVARSERRQGIGRQLVEALLAEARRRGYREVRLETTADWTDAAGLYRACGFREIEVRDGDRHFAIALT